VTHLHVVRDSFDCGLIHVCAFEIRNDEAMDFEFATYVVRGEFILCMEG